MTTWATLLATRSKRRAGCLDVKDYLVVEDNVGHTPHRQGCHRRMGDYILSGRALTIDELLVIQVFMEEGWIEMEEEGNREAQLHLSMFCCCFDHWICRSASWRRNPKLQLVFDA